MTITLAGLGLLEAIFLVMITRFHGNKLIIANLACAVAVLSTCWYTYAILGSSAFQMFMECYFFGLFIFNGIAYIKHSSDKQHV